MTCSRCVRCWSPRARTAAAWRSGSRRSAPCRRSAPRWRSGSRDAVTLERTIVAGLAQSETGADLLADELAGHLRALLRDVLCGHLDSDLRTLADELLAEAAGTPGDVPASLARLA